jgi:subtilisin family serine protease
VSCRYLAVLWISVVLLIGVVPFKSMFSGSILDVDSSLDVGSFSGYAPVMRVPAGVDKDHNGIEDNLEQEVVARLSNGTAREYVNVTVMLKAEPTAHDAYVFASSGGYLTTSPWTYAVYGFGGRIPYDEIGVFTKQCSDVLLVEKEAVSHASLAYAATQVGARTYVWSTLGLQGDPNSSIAIVDTGIDASQQDFSLGFGNQSLEKIVGWNDQTGTSTLPYDDNGHGSHVSGLAAGDGFFSLDASGYATATWGANLGSVFSSGTYLISGMMVNRTGTITLKVKWASTGTARLSVLSLDYGGKNLSSSSWDTKALVIPISQNTWYTLTYNVTSAPSGGYDMYHVLMSLSEGTGDLYVVFTMSWPYTPPSDGFSAWTGIAPQAKLVGVKVLDSSGSGTSTGLINGINWIIANRVTYHITVASMSLGFSSEVSSVDSAIVNLVNSGVTTVVAAGNDGSGSNYVYTPGSVDEVITVAAMNQFDSVTSYSSQGGTSRYTGQTLKPDVTAPGGSFYAVPLFSADSNYNDAEGRWADVQANDSAPMQGTSMATPIVAGAVDIVQQAMGGYSSWQWTRSQALQPKMILLMTATETYPNLRESSTSSYSPTLSRGGKDAQEGYGRLNLDAAADAVLKTYQVGTTVSGTLGAPPSAENISVLGQELAWARNVQLVSGVKYNFTLSVPSGADYDLYLYNTTGDAYGEPVILAKSAKVAVGGFENITYTPTVTGKYYLVVKRATESTGVGQFTLTSPKPYLQLTVTVSGHGVTNVTGTHAYEEFTNVTVLATPDTGYYFSEWLLNGGGVGFSNPYTVTMLYNYNLTAVFRAGVLIPLFGWTVDPQYTNAPNLLNSNASSLYLKLNAENTTSKAVIYSFNAPKLTLSDYASVKVNISGTSNALITLRYFMDDGSCFDVVYWQSPATLNATTFDLSPYAGKTLAGLVYIGLISADGTAANITITRITFETQAPPSTVPLSRWQEDPQYTNASYVLNSNLSSLHLELDAENTTSKVTIFNLNMPRLSLAGYTYVNATVTGTANSRITLRFFMDDGSCFDVVYWQGPTTLNATKFDLSPYAGRKLSGVVYIGLMSIDGTTSNITITQIVFETQTSPPTVPLSGWQGDPAYTNSPYVLNSSPSSLYLELDAENTTSKAVIFNPDAPKLNLTDYSYIKVNVTGTGNALTTLRFFMDDGSCFDVVYWQSSATLNITIFDLSPYSEKTLTGLVYVGLMSADGTTANITITQVAFVHV